MPPLTPCLIQQLPGPDLENQSQFSATSTKSIAQGNGAVQTSWWGELVCGENV